MDSLFAVLTHPNFIQGGATLVSLCLLAIFYKKNITEQRERCDERAERRTILEMNVKNTERLEQAIQRNTEAINLLHRLVEKISLTS